MEYLFSTSAQTLNSAIAPAKLHQEIEASSIVPSLDRVDTNGDEIKTVFLSALSTEEEALLAGIVNAHDGQQIVEDNGPQIFQLANTTDIGGIPKVAVYEAEGDFDSLVSHNYSDRETWPAGPDSTFIVEPGAGKKMFLKKAEVQFTHDIRLNGVSELYFDVWVGNPLVDLGQPLTADDPTFEPGVSPGNPLRFLFQRVVYKSILDVLNIGNAHYTMAPVDGLTVPLSTVQFNYPRAIPLLSSQLGQIRISSKDNIEIGGTFCTITFSTSTEEEL